MRSIISLHKKHSLLFHCFCLLSVLAIALPAFAKNIMETRLWAEKEKTRLVLETEKALDYSITSLNSPPRLVLDIPYQGANLTLSPKANLEDAQSYLKGIRNARLNETTNRIVFDLAAAIDYKIRRYSPIGDFKHRLVIDILPQDSYDPIFALLQSLEKDSDTTDSSDPFLVVIDPGHGGEDPGAVSPNKNYEKNIVLSISKQLVEQINQRPGMRAILTRDKDKFIKLFNRVHIAHRLKADAFISIHADSVKSRKARGSSVFVLSEKGASSRFAKQMANKANLSDLIGGETEVADPSLYSILREFSLDGKDKASYILAGYVLKNMSKINYLHKKNVEAAGFAVLKSPSIPSILVETAFISNAKEEKKLLNPDHQHKIAKAIADAVEKYKKTVHL